MTRAIDLRHTLAENLRFFMGKSESYGNANRLGTALSISPNTVRNLLNPKQRPVTADKPEGYPTLDTLLKIAGRLDCQVWELLHPDIQRSIREREMYERIESDYQERAKKDKAIKQRVKCDENGDK